MDVPETFYNLVEAVCCDLYIKSLKEIPPDVVAAIRRAAATETKEVARRIFSHYLQSIDLGSAIQRNTGGVCVQAPECDRSLRMFRSDHKHIEHSDGNGG